MIELKGVSKYYHKKKVLNNINLKIEKNDMVLILGTNGSGKTTIINLIIKALLLHKKDKGKVIVNGDISYLPEKIILPTLIKGFDFLMMMLNMESSKESIIEYMNKYNVPNQYINTYSKGMMQKIMIIRTILLNRDIYIFDEPLDGLDNESKKKFTFDLRNLSKKNKTIIISTHDEKHFIRLVNKVINIEDGKLYE